MFKPIQDRGKGKKKGSPTCFLLVTSTHVGISPYNFLAFSFATLCVPQASLKLLNLKSRASLKKIVFFWSNPYKIEVMITPLTERLDLSNFGHMITSKI